MDCLVSPTGVNIAVCLGSCIPRRVKKIYRHDNDDSHHDASNNTVFLRHHRYVFINQTDYFFHLLSPKLPI